MLGQPYRTFNPGISTVNPLLTQIWTADGQRASLTDANGNATTFAYDGFDRLATTTYPGGTTEAFTYDADSNVLTRKTRAGGTPIAFSYDTLNRLITRTPPTGPVVSYTYDLAGRLKSASDNTAAIPSAVSPTGSPVAYTTSFTYDAMNRPTGVSWNPAPTATAPGTASSVVFAHSYNKVNQRIGLAVSDNAWINYPAAAASTVSYTANNLNQYTAVGAVTPTYDTNGNLTFDGTYTLGYDVENRLVSASGAGTSAAYTFDAQGNRKTVTTGGSTTVFVTDADDREVLEYDGASGAIQRWYAYGLGPNDVLGQMNVPANTRTTFVHDLLGSVVATMASSTGTLSRFGYRPYGASTAPATPFGFTGQRLDAEAGGLYYFRARAYSPRLGRFLQPDPIGYDGGLNLYAYVGNDPLNLIDPYGLKVLDGVQAALFVASFCPSVCGSVVSLVDAGISGARGDYWGAGASVAAAIGGLVSDAGAIKVAALGGIVAADALKASKVARELTLSRKLHGEAALHAEDAIRAGKPQVLTIDRAGTAANRRASTSAIEKVPGKHLDEYPPAMFKLKKGEPVLAFDR